MKNQQLRAADAIRKMTYSELDSMAQMLADWINDQEPDETVDTYGLAMCLLGWADSVQEDLT